MNEGYRASEILADPLVKKAFHEIEAAILEQWKSTADTELRDELWYTLKGLNRFRGYLEIAMQNEQFDLAMEEKNA